MHDGKLILARDDKTIIFKPSIPFNLSEKVTVLIKQGIKNLEGQFLPNLKFKFQISKSEVDADKYTSLNGINSELQEKFNNRKKETLDNNIIKDKTPNDSLPDDFPNINLMINNSPSPGQIFAAPFKSNTNDKYGYLVIMDQSGVPVFYRRENFVPIDFKQQYNGYLSYFDYNLHKFYLLDSSYTKIDSFACGNGYQTDPHELNMLPNGHVLLIGLDFQVVRMDTIVQGGDSAAVVTGDIIQELDQDKNVVFQWRSWDHFQITDATYDIDLTAPTIDYVHCNAIEKDNDGNLLISSRHLDEITKIDRQTGDIIWRWGGEYCKNNQFTFTNDPIGFSHQHDIRRIPNGDLTLFDDGNLHDPQFTRVCEYQMDEVNKTVNLVWQFQNNPSTFSLAMGNMQRLNNGNSVIGWGYNYDPPSVSEVTPDGNTIWAVGFPSAFYNYRAFKFNWKTNYFVTNPDSIFFNQVPVGESDTSNFTITNNSDSILILNHILISDSNFSIVQSPPFQINAHSNVTLTVKFKPFYNGYFNGNIYLNADHYNQRIAQALFVHGRTDTTLTSTGQENKINKFRLSQNYPNPFNPSTTISFSIPASGIVHLEVYDIMGNKVKSLLNNRLSAGNHKIVFDAKNLASGVYFYRLLFNSNSNLNSKNFSMTKKLMIIK